MADEPYDEPEGMFLSSGDSVVVDVAVLALSPGMVVEVYNEAEEGSTAPGTLRMRVQVTSPTTLQLTSNLPPT